MLDNCYCLQDGLSLTQLCDSIPLYLILSLKTSQRHSQIKKDTLDLCLLQSFVQNVWKSKFWFLIMFHSNLVTELVTCLVLMQRWNPSVETTPFNPSVSHPDGSVGFWADPDTRGGHQADSPSKGGGSSRFAVWPGFQTGHRRPLPERTINIYPTLLWYCANVVDNKPTLSSHWTTCIWHRRLWNFSEILVTWLDNQRAIAWDIPANKRHRANVEVLLGPAA